MSPLKKARVALIHDWLTGMRGGEKVFEVLCRIFPTADIFTLVHTPGKVSPVIESHKIITSPLQHIPGIARSYRHFLPLMPWAIEQFDFRDYDLMVSTSHCVAKGAIPGLHAVHWDYCHTPMRYIWDQYDDYFGKGKTNDPARLAMSIVRPYLQKWDIHSNSRVHHFIANSENVRERIKRIYKRDAIVIHPPVDYDFFSVVVGSPPLKDPYYLIVSALAPYKRIDLAIEVFNNRKDRLIIIGDGPEYTKLRKIANRNIEFLGWLDKEQLRSYYAYATAVLFPGEEDFGIVPLEAMSAGTPIIAYRKGGALETVIDNETGLFFDKQTITDVTLCLERFLMTVFLRDKIRQHAQKFDQSAFIQKMRNALIEYSSEMS